MDSASEAAYLSGGRSPLLEPTPSSPQTGTKGDFLGRPVVNLATKGASLAVYVPTAATQLASVLCNPILVKGVAGTAFVTAWTLDKALQIPDYLLQTGTLHATLSMLEPATREIITQSLQNAENSLVVEREALQKAGDLTRHGLRVIKVISSAIPFAGVLTEAVSTGVEIGQKVEQLERKAEQAHLMFARSVLSKYVSVIKAVTPAVFWGVGKVGQIARMPVGWAKDRAFEVWTNPEAPEQRLQNLADRLDSYSSRMWHCFETVHTPQIAVDLTEKISQVKNSDIEKFNEKRHR